MTTKKMLEAEAEAVKAYRAGAERRRAQRNLQRVLGLALSNSDKQANYGPGVVTIKKPTNAKPVSALGGATKVFGHSKISVPEMWLIAKRRSPR